MSSPVLYQSRTRPKWRDERSWTDWEDCTKEQAEDCWKRPEINDWLYEARALYTSAQPAPEKLLALAQTASLELDKVVKVFQVAEPVQQELVGEVFINTGFGELCAPMKDIRWKDGMMPPAGTKLYTSPPPADPVAWNYFVSIASALIKAADDAASDADYMLDSDDCIKVLRGEWTGPMMNDCPQPKKEAVTIDRACFDRGCACFDSRTDKDAVIVEKRS